MVKDENEALNLAATPEKIISPLDCNLVIGYLNGAITDLALAEFEGEVASQNELVKLLNVEGKTNKLAEAEWRTGETYRKWRLMKLELAKLRAYRKVLQKKEEILQFTSRQTRTSYGGESYLG